FTIATAPSTTAAIATPIAMSLPSDDLRRWPDCVTAATCSNGDVGGEISTPDGVNDGCIAICCAARSCSGGPACCCHCVLGSWPYGIAAATAPDGGPGCSGSGGACPPITVAFSARARASSACACATSCSTGSELESRPSWVLSVGAAATGANT